MPLLVCLRFRALRFARAETYRCASSRGKDGALSEDPIRRMDGVHRNDRMMSGGNGLGRRPMMEDIESEQISVAVFVALTCSTARLLASMERSRFCQSGASLSELVTN